MWSSVGATVERIRERDSKWLAQLREYERLYEDDQWYELEFKGQTYRVTFNVIRACINTLAARIAKSKPRPMYVTDDANWKYQRRAKKRTDVVTGIYQKSGAFDLGPSVFKDGAIGGTGTIRWEIDDGAVVCDRVLPEELVLDEQEARYGKPKTAYHCRLVSRDVLIAQFPEWEAVIEDAPSPDAKWYRGTDAYQQDDTDLIEVIEAWHLSATSDSGDGRWCISIDGVTLESANYDKNYLPFASFRWEPPLRGFRGTGVAKELAGIQYAINRLMRELEEGHHLMAKGRVFVAKGTINKAQLTSKVGSVIEFDPQKGPAPTSVVWQAFGAETYQYLERLYQRAFELSGVSQLSASGKKPSGVDAAVAMRELQDIESERFALPSLRFEAMYMDSAPIVVGLIRDLIEDDKSPTIRTKAGRFMAAIDAQDVIERDDDDQYEITAYPASMLPKSISGRRQEIAEWQKQGWISPDEAMQLMEMPDTDKFISLRIAGIELAQMVVERVLDDGVMMEPEKYWDIETTFRIAHQELLRGTLNGAPEDRMELLRRFTDRLEAMMQPPPDAAPPPPDAPMVGPEMTALPPDAAVPLM